MAIAPDTVSWEREQDLRQYLHTDGREVVSSPAVRLWGIAPVREGLTGRGGGGDGSPLPCLMSLRLNGIRENTPTARRFAAPPPAPFRGGGQSVWRLGR